MYEGIKIDQLQLFDFLRSDIVSVESLDVTTLLIDLVFCSPLTSTVYPHVFHV